MPGFLLISHDTAVVASLLPLLAKYDVRVVTVDTPGEAVRALLLGAGAGLRVRLALIDVVLPDAESMALVRLLRASPSTADANLVLLSSLSPTTAQCVRNELRLDGFLCVHAGLLHAEAAIRCWFAERANSTSNGMVARTDARRPGEVADATRFHAGPPSSRGHSFLRSE